MDDALHSLGSQKVLPARIKVNLSSELITYQLASNASAGEYCDAISQQRRFGVAISLQQRFEIAEIVVLAKVTESTYPALSVTLDLAYSLPACLSTFRRAK
jgi:hypothetical protein